MLPLATAAAGVLLWAALPLLLGRHMVDLLVFAGLYTIAGLGVAFLLGHCGIVTLAQSAFYGIGAYSVAYLTTQTQLGSFAGIALGIGISGALAFAVGWPVLRLSGYFLALATLALGIIGHVLFQQWDWITGGTLGIGGIPKLALLGFEFNSPLRFYYLVWIIAGLLIWSQRNLLRSRNGLAMMAMRDSPEAAASLGITLHTLRVRMFVLSAVLGALAGSLLAHYVSFVSVDSFAIDRAVTFLLLAVLGGVHTVWGAALGALFVTLVPEWLSKIGEFHQVLFAITLIAVVIFVPEGIGGALQRLRRKVS